MAPPSLQLHHVAHPTLHAAAQLRLSKAVNSSENALTGAFCCRLKQSEFGRAAAEPVANIAESSDLVLSWAAAAEEPLGDRDTAKKRRHPS